MKYVNNIYLKDQLVVEMIEFDILPQFILNIFHII